MRIYTVKIGIIKQQKEVASMAVVLRSESGREWSETGREAVGSENRQLLMVPQQHKVAVDFFGWFVLALLFKEEKAVIN